MEDSLQGTAVKAYNFVVDFADLDKIAVGRRLVELAKGDISLKCALVGIPKPRMNASLGQDLCEERCQSLSERGKEKCYLRLHTGLAVLPVVAIRYCSRYNKRYLP